VCGVCGCVGVDAGVGVDVGVGVCMCVGVVHVVMCLVDVSAACVSSAWA
jgi:hypothetical protein